jgi:hypothetical protein
MENFQAAAGMHRPASVVESSCNADLCRRTMKLRYVSCLMLFCDA